MCVEAYLAGYFDGEGCILVSSKKGGTHQLMLMLGSVDSTPLHLFADRYGGNVRPARVLPSGKRFYKWFISNGEALKALQDMLPYLTVKKSQAELALTWPLGSKPNSSSNRLSDDEWNGRQYIFEGLKLLKQVVN